MSDPWDEHEKFLTAFLRGTRPPNLKNPSFFGWTRDGAELRSTTRAKVVARRLTAPRARGPVVAWTDAADRYVASFLSHAASAAGFEVKLVRTRVCPTDAAEGLGWLRWEERAWALQQRLLREGFQQPASLMATLHFPRPLLRETLARHPRLIQRRPTRFWRGDVRGSRPALREELWVTPEGADLADLATALAKGQGLAWPDAFDLVAGGAPTEAGAAVTR